MTDLTSQISAGLERAFAQHGFAEPNIETLREAAGVSLRTLYRYAASRDEMVRMALTHRNARYLVHILADFDVPPSARFPIILDRVADWMTREASHGCLVHAAVAAAPQDAALRALLSLHKADVAEKVAEATGLIAFEPEITLILEGFTQSWPLLGDTALESAKRLAIGLTQDRAA